MRFSAFIKLFIISLSVVFWVSCKNSTGKDTNNPSITTPPSELNNTIKQDEFNGDDIEKELPNGDKFTINTIKEITDTPTVASEKIYQTKIDESGDGFFVVNGDSIEGTFTKDGKSYSIGTFKDGQRIVEVNTLNDSDDILLPPLNKNNSNLSKYSSPKYRLTDNTKANVSILFLYNNDFWNWCDNDNTIVKNKLDAMIAYTNT